MQSDRYGLYVHVPFCVRKCPYCDFNTFDLERSAVRTFLSALHQELILVRDELGPPPFDTLFIGGGTPTVLSGTQLSELVGWVHETVGLAPGAEVSIEANPGSVTVNGLKAMRASGVNRISMGVQSFSDDMLQRIGRNHTVRDVLTSYEMMRSAGIANINFDLMYALPGQSVADWDKTLKAALDLAPEHLSCYSLIIEEGTPFADLHRKGQLDLPLEDDEATMYENTVKACVDAGYEHYEISNFARTGFTCRHNELYWRNEQWLGVGPGAHSFWKNVRFWNERSLDAYTQQISQGRRPVAGKEPRTVDELMDETVMLGLRLVDGLPLAQFNRRFGVHLMDVYPEIVQRLCSWELLEVTGDHLRLTPRGRMLGNRVLSEFLR